MILALQASGFAAAALLMIWFHADPRCTAFFAAFAVHAIGDALFLRKEGLPMNLKERFLALLARIRKAQPAFLVKIEKYIKIGPWLQFVGLMLAIGGLLALAHWYGKPLAYVGIGVSFAGFVYDKIYP